MLLLFLDTETSGLNFQSDQIIEIAGVITNFDPVTLKSTEVSRFESLVSLRKPLDEHITRITGISDLELSTAQGLIKVQESWANWIDEYAKNVTAIVGHSIDFDAGFLKNEGWLLPEKFELIDTLNLCKILLPQYTAINLEFLIEKLGLEKKASTNKLNNKKLLPHRALFDTLICKELFSTLLLILQEEKLPQDFYNVLQANFLPLDIKFYSKESQPKDLSKTSQNSTYQTINKHSLDVINFRGEIQKKSLSFRLNCVDYSDCDLIFNKLWHISKSKILTIVVLQIYYISVIKKTYPSSELKLHGNGKLIFIFAELILDTLEQEIDTKSHDINKNSIVLPWFENIISQVRTVAEDSLDLGHLINFLEIYTEISDIENSSDKTLINNIQKVLSSYDFLILSLQPLLRSGEYLYKSSDLVYREKDMYKRFKEFVSCIEKIYYIEYSNDVLILQLLKKNILNIVSKFDLSVDGIYYFRFFSQNLSISRLKNNFTLSDHFSGIFKAYPDLTVETYLPPEEFSAFTKLVCIDNLFEDLKPKIKYLHAYTEKDFMLYIKEQEYKSTISQHVTENQYNEVPKLQDFYMQKLNMAIQSKMPILILSGQNSTLKDSQRILTQHFESKDYLLLGESGSLTKIGSKLVRNFQGIAVLKVSDFNYLLKLSDLPRMSEIWVLNQPYIWIHLFWQKESKKCINPDKFILNLKKISLQSQINWIYYHTQTKVFFLRSYVV